MSSHLHFSPRISVTSMKVQSSLIISISVKVYPSRFIPEGAFLPSYTDPYPMLHATMQYPFDGIDYILMDYFQLISPSPGWPYWRHLFRKEVPLSRTPKLLRVRFWLDLPSEWHCVGSRDWRVLYDNLLHIPRNYASERIGGNPQEQECDNVSEVATEILEEQDDGVKEEEDLAEGTNEGS
ncbi:hypothetical protein MMC28_006730 [Mycoblastus sanguinarius]|nr:hypothetical protein [Mycoblastus sanguinarius]